MHNFTLRCHLERNNKALRPKNSCDRHQGGISVLRFHLTNIGIPMLKIRRSRDRLIFNMGSPYLGKTVFILRQPPAENPRICSQNILLVLLLHLIAESIWIILSISLEIIAQIYGDSKSVCHLRSVIMPDNQLYYCHQLRTTKSAPRTSWWSCCYGY